MQTDETSASLHPSQPERPEPEMVAAHARLRMQLVRELLQTERSAQLHCANEAGRLGNTPPAEALRACARHAERVAVEVRALAREEHVPGWQLGRSLGRFLAATRDRVLDRLIPEDLSYRTTLLGLHHGIGVVRMLQHVADASGKVEVGGFCTRWLEERVPLVEGVTRAMTWLALHPTVAIDHPGWWPRRRAAVTGPADDGAKPRRRNASRGHHPASSHP